MGFCVCSRDGSSYHQTDGDGRGHVSLHIAPAADLTTCDWPTIVFLEQEKGFSSFFTSTPTLPMSLRHCCYDYFLRHLYTMIIRFQVSHFICKKPFSHHCITNVNHVWCAIIWNNNFGSNRKWSENHSVIKGDLTSSSVIYTVKNKQHLALKRHCGMALTVKANWVCARFIRHFNES